MNLLKVKPYTTQNFDLWNTFVSKAKNGTFLFHRDFMEYHKDRFEDFSLMVFKNDKLIAVLPANRKDHVIFSHQGLTYGGLVFDSKLKFQVVLEIFKSVLEFLSSLDISILNIKMLPSFYSAVPNDELLYLMFLLKAELYRRDSLSVINLKAPISFSKNRIEGCKRAKKHGLVIKEVDSCDAFWNTILIPNLIEKHEASPVHCLEEITLLKSKFPENIRQFNVYYEGKLVAGTTVFVTETVVHSQYISGNASKNTLGSLDALHEHLIKNVFKDKLYFDFGTSNENNGNNINKGLQYWKEGFGARTSIQDFYILETKNFKALDTVFI